MVSATAAEAREVRDTQATQSVSVHVSWSVCDDAGKQARGLLGLCGCEIEATEGASMDGKRSTRAHDALLV